MATALESLQRLTFNFSGKVRRVKYRGRDYLVAPMVLINPGVLNGSKGPLFYPPEVVSKNPRRWNGIPIVVYHPHRLGQPVSATEPGVLDLQGVGVVRNATSNGKLKAEGWFDALKTQKVNPSVYQKLLKHEPIELSTGLFTENVDGEGTFNGQQYVATVREYAPDHLAVLPDQVGACSISDGCGVVVNQESSMSLQDKLASLLGNKKKDEEEEAKDGESEQCDKGVVDNAWTDEARAAAAEARKSKSFSAGAKSEDAHALSGLAGGNDHSAKALEAAHLAAAHAKNGNASGVAAEHSKAAFHHTRAAMMHREQAFQAGKHQGNQESSINHTRAADIHLEAAKEHHNSGMNYLTHNQSQEGGPTMANDTKLTENERKAVVDSLIANGKCCWEESDRETLNSLEDNTLAKLAKQAEIAANAKSGAEVNALDEDDADDAAAKEKTIKKGQAVVKGKSVGELSPTANALSAQDSADLAFARRYRLEHRQGFVKTITANSRNKFTLKQLEGMSDEVLANLASLAQENSGSQETSHYTSFFGQQGAAQILDNAESEEPPLVLGHIDYKELAVNRGNK